MMTLKIRLFLMPCILFMLTGCNPLTTSMEKSLNATITVPQGWERSFSIGGAMILVPEKSLHSGTNLSNDSDASLSRINLKQYFSNDSKPKESYTLEDYKMTVLAYLVEENIGQKLQIMHKNTTLAGYPAFEVTYNYQAEGEAQKSFTKKIITKFKDNVYILRLSGIDSAFHRDMKDFTAIKDSMKILKK